MNDMTFQTGGDWATTTLYSNGQEVPAAQLLVQLAAGRDDYGDPMRGGVENGAELTAYVRPQEAPEEIWDILPGRLTLTFPGHSLVLENYHPRVDPQQTRVWYNGQDVTTLIVELFVDVNALEDSVTAFVTVYKPHFFGTDEAVTYTIVA